MVVTANLVLDRPSIEERAETLAPSRPPRQSRCGLNMATFSLRIDELFVILRSDQVSRAQVAAPQARPPRGRA